MSSSVSVVDNQAQQVRKLIAIWRTVFWSICGLMVLVIVLYVVPLSGPLVYVRFFSFFVCSFLAGLLTLIAANGRTFQRARTDAQFHWMQRERVAWTLVSIGLFFWSFAELIWRYQMLVGHSTFPSVADIGYSLMPIFVFAGMLFQPTIFRSHRESLLSALDCLIASGSIVAMAWYFFFGRRMFATQWTNLGLFLSIYYPAADTVLLCCVVVALLRCKNYLLQARTLWSWILVGIGFLGFLSSDVMVNLQQSYATYLDQSPYALGWGIGLLMFALVAPVRSLSFLTDEVEENVYALKRFPDFSLISVLPYFLVGALFLVVVISALVDDDHIVVSVLIIISASVFCTLILRQILTMHDNALLARSQARALCQLEEVSKQLEIQASFMARRNEELEQGIQHLKYVQASLANGNLRARAHLTSGELLPLAASLNLLADRLMRLELADVYCENLTAALVEICNVTERWRMGKPFVLYPLYKQFAITKRLVNAIGLPGPSASGRNPFFSNSGPTSTIQRPQVDERQIKKPHPPSPFGVDNNQSR